MDDTQRAYFIGRFHHREGRLRLPAAVPAFLFLCQRRKSPGFSGWHSVFIAAVLDAGKVKTGQTD